MVNNPLPDMGGDSGINMPRVQVEVSEADKCNPNLDSDSDGLDNEERPREYNGKGWPSAYFTPAGLRTQGRR